MGFGVPCSGGWFRDQVSGVGGRVSSSGFRVSGCGFQNLVLDCNFLSSEGIEGLNFGFGVLGVRLGYEIRDRGSRFRVSGFGFRFLGFGLRVSGVRFGFRVSGFGFRGSGLNQASGFEFRATGCGLALARGVLFDDQVLSFARGVEVEAPIREGREVHYNVIHHRCTPGRGRRRDLRALAAPNLP